MTTWWAEFYKVFLNPWAAVGLFGQALFFSRWIIQWIASEKKKESYVPLSFWFMSLIGGLLVFVYTVQRHDPVFMVAQLVGICNYTRNIFLVRRMKAK